MRHDLTNRWKTFAALVIAGQFAVILLLASRLHFIKGNCLKLVAPLPSLDQSQEIVAISSAATSTIDSLRPASTTRTMVLPTVSVALGWPEATRILPSTTQQPWSHPGSGLPSSKTQQSGRPVHPLSQLYPQGGVSLCGDDLRSAFELEGWELKGCGKISNCKGSYPKQVPKLSLPYLVKGYVNWSQEHSDLLIAALTRGEDISPPDYPKCVPDFYEALAFAEKNASLDPDEATLVAGSVSPWVEAVLRARGFTKVFTSDYGERNISTNVTTIVRMDDLREAWALYGNIVSFSSIEHDGLGRYCDPVNPMGDRAALQEFRQWLKPGGLLFFGIPVGEKAVIWNNWHRIFDWVRFKNITQGFKLLHTVDTNYGQTPWYGSIRNRWQNQPWFVLQRE